ncbi:hypothetical protein [Acinetobacter soli]|uniref:hypothetical protein n=2 Tax=Acinetobacter soli TaxID=487316 RepID=UPI00301A4742
MKIQTANGYYLPSFFFMKIESNDDVLELIENNEQTFVHEYIHFLQDLILPYNIRNTLISNRYFSLINSIGYRDKEIIRPFSKWDEDAELTMKQFSFTWGGGDFKNNKEKIVNIQNEYFEIYTSARVFGYILTTNTGYQYHIGARDFLEYIAHKIEKKNWKVNHPAFPYQTIDLIFEYYKLEWVTDEVKLCLVEFSLYNDNPMNQLIFILEKLVIKQPEEFKNYETCSNYLLRFQWQSRGGFEETIFTKTERRLIDLKQSLSDKYANSNFNSISAWINHIIEFSKKNLSNRFIFTELFMMDGNEFRRKISLFVKEIGIPLMFNQKEESASLLPEIYDHNDFIQLYAAFNFMEYARSTQKACGMLNFCNSSRPEIVDDNCKNNPILRSNCSELCPFGVFVKSYGLHNIQWKIA